MAKELKINIERERETKIITRVISMKRMVENQIKTKKNAHARDW